MIDIHVLCGSESTEHEISLRSAKNVINDLDKEKYNVSMTYITKDGRFVPIGNFKEDIKNPEDLQRTTYLTKQQSIMQFIDFIQSLNDPIIIPVIHGATGEDGQIQGFLKTLGLRFIGNDVESSAICMDKATTNNIFKAYDIPQARYYVLERKRFDRDEDHESIISNIFDACGETVYVKPSSNGSSVGVNKATRENIIEALKDAFQYDNKVVIEEEIKGVELEVSVIGNNNTIASLPGSYTSTKELFDYDAKYMDNTLIKNSPHVLDETKTKQIRQLAIDAYLATGCNGFARVDSFMDNDGNFYVNEINTYPGMTPTSLFSDLWKVTDDTSFTQLLDKLIDYSIEYFEQQKAIKRGL